MKERQRKQKSERMRESKRVSCMVLIYSLTLPLSAISWLITKSKAVRKLYSLIDLIYVNHSRSLKFRSEGDKCAVGTERSCGLFGVAGVEVNTSGQIYEGSLACFSGQHRSLTHLLNITCTHTAKQWQWGQFTNHDHHPFSCPHLTWLIAQWSSVQNESPAACPYSIGRPVCCSISKCILYEYSLRSRLLMKRPKKYGVTFSL